jgi:hypothetical protein
LLPRVPALTAKLAVGPVLSNLIVSGAALALRPASLVHEPLKTTPVVSVAWNWSAVQFNGVLTSSMPDVWTVTSVVYQPFVPDVPAVTAKATAVGGVESNLNPNGASLLELPASSVQCPFTDPVAVSGPL